MTGRTWGSPPCPRRTSLILLLAQIAGRTKRTSLMCISPTLFLSQSTYKDFLNHPLGLTLSTPGLFISPLTSLESKSIRQTKKFAANLMTGQVTFDSVRKKYHETWTVENPSIC